MKEQSRSKSFGDSISTTTLACSYDNYPTQKQMGLMECIYAATIEDFLLAAAGVTPYAIMGYPVSEKALMNQDQVYKMDIEYTFNEDSLCTGNKIIYNTKDTTLVMLETQVKY